MSLRIRHLAGLFSIAIKDTRGNRLKLFIYAVSLCIGIAAMTLTLALRESVSTSLDQEARSLLGADLAFESKEPVNDYLPAALAIEATAREVRFRTMASFESDFTRLVQIRAIDGNYPFYGDITTSPQSVWNSLSTDKDSVLVDESLLLQAGGQVGQTIKIGEGNFKIAGVVTQIAGLSIFGAAVAPRVYMNSAAVEQTALLGRLSLADYYLYVKLLPQNNSPQTEDLKSSLPPSVTLTTVEDRKERLGSISSNAILFFSLVGLICLALGTVGATASLYFYLRSKIHDAAIMRCLGYSGTHIVVIYLMQLLCIALISSIAALIAGLGAYRFTLPLISGLFSSELSVRQASAFVFPALGIAVFTVLIAALPGILILRRASPLLLIKEDDTLRFSLSERISMILVAALFLPLMLSVVLGNMRTGLIYGSALNAVLLFVWMGSGLLKQILRKGTLAGAAFEVRYGLLSLIRPGNFTNILLSAFSVTYLLAAGLLISRAMLRNRMELATSSQTPNLYIYDVKQAESEPIRQMIGASNMSLADEVPIVLMRITAVNGQPVPRLLSDPASGIPEWTLKRDYWTTYRAEMQPNEEIVAGNWVSEAVPGQTVPISLDATMAERLKVGLGDTLTFDVQGLELETRIESLRKIRWEQMQRNAFVVFPRGVLEAAPKFLFLTAFADSAAASAAIQRKISGQFPGVSVIDIRTVVSQLQVIFEKIEMALSMLTLIVALTAGLILFSVMIGGLQSRLAERKLLRILGATALQLKRISFFEYLALSLITVMFGNMLAIGCAYILSKYYFQTEFILPWGGLIMLSLITILLILGLAWYGTRQIRSRLTV